MALEELAYTRIADIVTLEEVEELWEIEDVLFEPTVYDVLSP